MVVRFENFHRDGARHHAPCCGKGQQIVAPAIFKAFSKNARIGDRSGYLVFRSRESGAPMSHCIVTVVAGVRAPLGGEAEPLLPPLKKRQHLKMLESGIDPGTSRFEVGYEYTKIGHPIQ